LSKKLVPEKHVSYYAFWVGRYFNYARKKEVHSDIYVENVATEFIEALKSDSKMSDWQIRQAHDNDPKFTSSRIF
jgi:hypothetical protein